MGRKSKLTPERQEKIVEAIELGATYELAAQYAGIHPATMYRWLEQGEKARSGRYCEFRDAIKEAEGAGAVQSLKTIKDAARDGQWTAAAWKLERRYPQDYGRRVHEIQGKDGGPIPITILQGVKLEDL